MSLAAEFSYSVLPASAGPVGRPALSCTSKERTQNMKFASLVLLTALSLTGCSGQEDEQSSTQRQKTEVMNFVPAEMPYKK